MVKKEKDQTGYQPKVGDTVICEHKTMRYVAKILDSRKDPDSKEKHPPTQFLIHYKNWSKNWDEWVTEDRIFQYNDVEMAVMQDLNAHASSRTKSGSARKKLGLQKNQANTSNVSYSASTSTSDKLSESETLEPEPILLDKEVKIKIPDELRTWLIDDDNMIRNKKLTILPAQITISTILKDFVSHKRLTSKTVVEVMLTELTLGIKDYFNVMLGSQLLYKFERLQYQMLLKEHGKDVDLANFYGVIHLVRLFTRIGKPLAASALSPQNVQTVVNFMQELLKFISKQTNLFDLDKNYYIAPPDYIKNSSK